MVSGRWTWILAAYEIDHKNLAQYNTSSVQKGVTPI